MAAATGVFSNLQGTQALSGKAAPMAATAGSGSGGSDGSTTNSATISANDFLTLLVTEMQNQDPTAQTDPNEYVNQLVAVNSLEQLIGINQTLTTAMGTPAGSSGGSTPSGQVQAAAPAGAAAAGAHASPHAPAVHPSPSRLAPGNLSVPAPDPAAQQVAHALDGRGRPAVISARRALR